MTKNDILCLDTVIFSRIYDRQVSSIFCQELGYEAKLSDEEIVQIRLSMKLGIQPRYHTKCLVSYYVIQPNVKLTSSLDTRMFVQAEQRHINRKMPNFTTSLNRLRVKLRFLTSRMTV